MHTRKHFTRSLIPVFIFLFFAALLFQPASSWPKPVNMIPQSFSEIAKKAKSSVVNIRTVKISKRGGRVYRHFFGQPFGNNDMFNDFFEHFMGQGPSQDNKERSLGSGFIISSDGYIVTNNHVIEDADQITVKLVDEKEYDAEIVGTDATTDLALIKIDAEHLEPLKIGDSDSLEVGTWVVAIGSPFGLEQTVTAGIVSAKGRILGSGPYDDFIQTDASINPGNSGGPLLNLQGEVVGINTAIIASGQGIGFAIPTSLAKGIIAQLKDSGEVTRGWMGVAIQDITVELAEYYNIEEKDGVLVAKVYKDNPADKAGIKPGDIITAVDGKKVSMSRDLTSSVAGFGAGSRVKVTLIRDGREKNVYVKLAKRSESEPGAVYTDEGFDELGFQLTEIDQSNAEKYGYPSSAKGLVVTDIKPETKAADSGIRRGDLLLEVNHHRVENLKQYAQLISRTKKGDRLRFLFQRRNLIFAVGIVR
ncbi:MAG: DegQ family serine endoprotease [Thermodesulfobacteriota bacterium]|nr:DegQ family serine endoprotease [Thermodesulfobacteriota bacterium]